MGVLHKIHSVRDDGLPEGVTPHLDVALAVVKHRRLVVGHAHVVDTVVHAPVILAGLALAQKLERGACACALR